MHIWRVFKDPPVLETRPPKNWPLWLCKDLLYPIHSAWVFNSITNKYGIIYTENYGHLLATKANLTQCQDTGIVMWHEDCELPVMWLEQLPMKAERMPGWHEAELAPPGVGEAAGVAAFADVAGVVGGVGAVDGGGVAGGGVAVDEGASAGVASVGEEH